MHFNMKKIELRRKEWNARSKGKQGDLKDRKKQ
jgi:hypothetical protein